MGGRRAHPVNRPNAPIVPHKCSLVPLECVVPAQAVTVTSKPPKNMVFLLPVKTLVQRGLVTTRTSD